MKKKLTLLLCVLLLLFGLVGCNNNDERKDIGLRCMQDIYLVTLDSGVQNHKEIRKITDTSRYLEIATTHNTFDERFFYKRFKYIGFTKETFNKKKSDTAWVDTINDMVQNQGFCVNIITDGTTTKEINTLFKQGFVLGADSADKMVSITFSKNLQQLATYQPYTFAENEALDEFSDLAVEDTLWRCHRMNGFFN